MAVILIIDDEENQRNILKTILDDEGYETYAASSAESGLKIVREMKPDVVLTDLKMEGMDGIELIEALPDEPFVPPAIVMTAFGTISSAVDAIKKGAFDYLAKPLDKDVLLITIRRAVEKAELLKENLQLQKALFERFKIEGIVGHSAGMVEALEVMKKVSSVISRFLSSGKAVRARNLLHGQSITTVPAGQSLLSR